MPDDREITNEEILGAIIALQKSVDEGFKRTDGELEAIRNVVDNDLAGQGQVMQLEGMMRELKRDVRRLQKAQT